MQASPPTPQAPVAPVAPAAPRAQAPGTPLTSQQVATLRARRGELSNQLQSVAGRRTRLAEALPASQGADRAGLEQRIAVLDERIVQIESDLAETGRLLTENPILGQSSSTGTAWYAPLQPDDVAAVTGFFTVVVLAPIAVAAARLLWKRGSAPARRVAAADAADAQRLDRIEQAVDAIAIEIERVAEGQRFVTRLLADERDTPQYPALGVGQRPAEPVPVPNAEAVRAMRRDQ